MAVPKFNEFMLPLLKLASDQQTHFMHEAYEKLADEFHLTQEDRNEKLPSGRQYTFENRIGWARGYLKKAKLLISEERGTFKITQRGLEVLKEGLSEINSKYLRKFKEFQEFQGINKGLNHKSEKATSDQIEESDKTPEENIDENYRLLNENLKNELLDKILQATPNFFEKLVIDLLVKMGYGGSRSEAGRAVGKSGDQGIDGIINEDKLGLDVIYLQAKRWTDNKVGSKDIRDFLGSLDIRKASKGVFITTSSFTKDAIEAASGTTRKVILIDGIKLTSYMIEHGLAVSTEEVYKLKKIDNDYFEDE